MNVKDLIKSAIEFCKPKSKLRDERIEGLTAEWNILRQILNEKSLRPIRLPNDLTSSEFNWLVQFLKEQRIKLINISGQIPKPVPEPLKVVREKEVTND